MIGRGKFITVEGIEGVGKSSQLQEIRQVLEDAGRSVVVTREPGGTPLAERMRELLLHADEESVPATAELLLIFAARSVHLENLIKPALERGQWVLCDRFTDATYAYQGGGRGLGSAAIAPLETLVQGALRPDLTILLDAEVELALARAKKRGPADRFEREQTVFHERVRQQYLAIAAADPERVRVVDASRSPSEVAAEVGELIRTFSDKAN